MSKQIKIFRVLDLARRGDPRRGRRSRTGWRTGRRTSSCGGRRLCNCGVKFHWGGGGLGQAGGQGQKGGLGGSGGLGRGRGGPQLLYQRSLPDSEVWTLRLLGFLLTAGGAGGGRGHVCVARVRVLTGGGRGVCLTVGGPGRGGRRTILGRHEVNTWDTGLFWITCTRAMSISITSSLPSTFSTSSRSLPPIFSKAAFM